MMNCERNTPTMAKRVLTAAGEALGSRRALRADFEHGQWWITNRKTGAQWAVNDADGPGTTRGFDFENVTRADE